MITAKTFDEIRDKVTDGDIIFIHKTAGFLNKLIKFFTKTQYSHCAVLFWLKTPSGKRLMLVESQGMTKRRIVSASEYEKDEFDIISSPIPWNMIQESCFKKVGKVDYGYDDAVKVGVRDFLLRNFGIAIKVPADNDNDEICSSFIAQALGMKDTMISPGDLFEQLTRNGNPVKIRVRKK